MKRFGPESVQRTNKTLITSLFSGTRAFVHDSEQRSNGHVNQLSHTLPPTFVVEDTNGLHDRMLRLRFTRISGQMTLGVIMKYHAWGSFVILFPALSTCLRGPGLGKGGAGQTVRFDRGRGATKLFLAESSVSESCRVETVGTVEHNRACNSDIG